MNTDGARPDRPTAADAGMSLIEVVIAISLIGVLATGSLGLYFSGMNAANSQQRREAAIAIANESMESVNAWSISTIYTGRFKNAVDALWVGATGVSGVAQTYPGWDSGASAGSTPALPLTRTVTRSGTDFTARLLIGSCMQPTAGGNCVRVASSPTGTTVPSGYTRVLRVISIVSWTAGTNCADGSCSYTAATLLDPSGDLEWKLNG